MKTFLLFAFLTSLAKSGLWITVGVLIKNHLESLLSLVTRKSMPNDIIEKNDFDKLNNVTKWIGLFIIFVGIGLALSAIVTFIMGLNMPTNRFNLKF
jgi:archaellum biogenesis protein FlaJ (TadC family)